MDLKKNIFPNLLVISINAWSDKNSTGNTISNHLGAWDNSKLSNVYLRDEEIDNNYCTNYFRICEKDILSTFLKGRFLGDEVHFSKDIKIQPEVIQVKTSKIKSYFIRIRPTIILLMRELFWKIGFRRTNKLDVFLHQNEPEIIHIHCPNLIYGHRVLHYCHKISKAKVVVFFGDEIYTYKNFYPLNFINQTILRYWIRKTLNISAINYAATPELSNYYSKVFGKEFKVLYKGVVIFPPKTRTRSKPLELVYAGNLLYGRWEVLALILKAIKKISISQNEFHMSIYSSTAISNKMGKSLTTKFSSLNGAKSFCEIQSILENADIVLHVESFKEEFMKITKYSFSTKIADCIQSGNCIMGVGPIELASMNFLKQSRAAILSNTFDDICFQLQNIMENSNIINDCSQRMYYFSEELFDLETIREELYKDLLALVKK